MEIYDIPLRTIDGDDATLAPYRDHALVVVNVASKCGFTPQYEGLQALYEEHTARGLTIVGFPCNQFLEQEPDSEAEIKQFCSMTYGVTFPLFEKCEVQGEGRHPLFAALDEVPDQDGETGEVRWNFEKFILSPGAERGVRFRTQVKPTDDAFIEALEAALPG